MKYFAYGSNMSMQQMRSLIGRVPPSVIARLRGYRLAFSKPMPEHPGYAHATVIPADDEVVGVLYDCEESDLDAMDPFEGIASGDYKRESLTVHVNGRPEQAVAYVACEDRLGSDLPTTEEYLAVILAGATDHSFAPADILRIKRSAGVA